MASNRDHSLVAEAGDKSPQPIKKKGFAHELARILFFTDLPDNTKPENDSYCYLPLFWKDIHVFGSAEDRENDPPPGVVAAEKEDDQQSQSTDSKESHDGENHSEANNSKEKVKSESENLHSCSRNRSQGIPTWSCLLDKILLPHLDSCCANATPNNKHEDPPDTIELANEVAGSESSLLEEIPEDTTGAVYIEYYQPIRDLEEDEDEVKKVSEADIDEVPMTPTNEETEFGCAEMTDTDDIVSTDDTHDRLGGNREETAREMKKILPSVFDRICPVDEAHEKSNGPEENRIVNNERDDNRDDGSNTFHELGQIKLHDATNSLSGQEQHMKFQTFATGSFGNTEGSENRADLEKSFHMPRQVEIDIKTDVDRPPEEESSLIKSVPEEYLHLQSQSQPKTVATDECLMIDCSKEIMVSEAEEQSHEENIQDALSRATGQRHSSNIDFVPDSRKSSETTNPVKITSLIVGEFHPESGKTSLSSCRS